MNLPARFLRREPVVEPVELEPFGSLPETPFTRPTAPVYEPPRVTVADPCHICAHQWHDLSCRNTTCMCPTSFKETA